ncbi:hypothetical protein LWI28_004234 [Acer negundo]|uniref:Uncharacterized protein n=1 Tax=Acer negundo TaxID=4023 RepID=A0AAD5ISL9_ACENE|nr:hypothetical protein LWI28_004234 [Acer negundo]
MTNTIPVSNDKELRDYPFSLRSPESSPSIPTGKKRKDYPLSDDDGGYLQLRRFDRHARVGFSFTNTADSPLAVSGEESDEEGDNDIKGKARSAPITKELAVALKSHDLFICFGHRTVGSTVIVANLWEVTDKDIDRFGKAILDACLRERSSISVSCDQCTLLVEEFEAKNVRGCKGQKKKVSRKKLTETLDTSLCKNGCDHRPKLGSFMGQAREACTLPFLVEASLVCYGVQTGIRRQAAS